MRQFSVRPAITVRGRKFKGLRGWAGKPTHPPLTDIPIGAYVLVAILDVLSAIGGGDHDWALALWRAGSFIMVIGLVVAVGAALTGLVDRNSSSEAGTQARRTINTHAAVMVVSTILAIVDAVWRISAYGDHLATPVGVMILSLVTAALVAWGATYGGSLVFDYGFNVETAGDHPVWHVSEDDVFPGSH